MNNPTNMKRIIFSTISFLLLTTTTLSAQEATRTVKGRVLDAATQKPLVGALVSSAEIQGYSALTQEDGTYELKIPVFATSISITSPEMNRVRIGLTQSEQQRDVLLYPDLFTDDYTTATNITANSQTGDFRFSNAVTIEDEIQKRLGAEARTISRSGTPGIGSVMFLNGLNSLHINSQPLIVIDGVIFDQQYDRTVLHEGFYNDILSNISPTDIESVQVMRNGTALYGAKGANGVILINTRRNHSMATRITASISAGVTLEPRFFEVMNGSQYRSYASDLLETTNTTIKEFKFLNENPTYYYYPQYHNDTDWKEEVYRTAFTQNYSINVEGGDDVADYNLSLGYINNESTLKNNEMNRVNIRFNSDIHLTKHLDIRFDAAFANQTRNLRNDGAPANYTEGTPTSTAFLAYAKSPMLSPYAFASGTVSEGHIDVADESYLNEALAAYSNYNYKLANPLAVNEFGEAENKNHFENSMVSLSVTPAYHFGKYLTLSEHFSYNLVNTNEKYYIPLNGVPSYYVSAVDAYCENEVRSMAGKQNSVMSDTRATYNRRFGAHQLDIMAGGRFNWETYTLTAQLGYNTSSDKMPVISSSLDHSQTYGSSDQWKSIAWYLQASYNYLQRYYLQANITAETSSRFGPDAKDALKAFEVPWGIFPGVQLAWVMSNESWFADIKGIDYLRLQTGYELSGNDNIDNYAARSYFRSHNFLQEVSGLSLDNIGNNRLQWETTSRFNIGLETHLLDNRLSLQFNYFNSKTNNLLMYQPLKYVTGLAYNWTNGGALRNEGFDVRVTTKVLNTRDWQWEVGASVGHYKNKITSLPDGAQRITPTNIYGATILTEVGQPANLFYGFKTNGVYATSEDAKADGKYILDENGVTKHPFAAGDMIFVDTNNDGEIYGGDDNARDDRVVIGDPNPDIYGNIFTTVGYKRFRLDLNFNYSLGNDVYNYMRQQMESGSRFMNQTTAMTTRWQTEGQQTTIPRVSFQDPMGNSRFSDRWIADGSYLRLKTVTLSYTLPMNTTFLQGLQFWVQANNVFTLTRYLGADPEFAMTGNVLGQGIDLGQLAQSRSFVAGIKINL